MAIHAQSNIQLNTIPAYTSLLGGHFVYRAHGTQSTPASANIVESSENLSNPAQWGYNTHIGASGIKLRYNEIDLSAWTNNSLSFYNPSTHEADAILTSSGLVLSKGGIVVGTTGSNNSIYISTDNLGSSVESLVPTSSGGISKTDWRAVIGSKFGVDSEGNLYANNADISGRITVASGSDLSLGLTNYSTTSEMNDAIETATDDMATTTAVQDLINTATGDLSNTISNTYATKTEAIVKEQRVYRRFTSAQSTFSGLNTWITSGDGYVDWSTNIPELTNSNTKYPFLYMSTQTQTSTQAVNNGTECNFTTPQLNAMTTVIDGNSIIANSISAGKISVENLSAINANMGSITAGSISKDYNSINFNNTPATLEFKNNESWDLATQGIKYDTNGLAIKGAITATSLTIGENESTYDGVAAINSTGYTIEIINDITAAPTGTTISDNQTYLYPIMRQNGEVIDYLLTLDTTVATEKNYYIRTYDSITQTYIYTLVTNPTGNPRGLSYYEAIDKTKYLWTYNGSATSIYGDSTLGGIVATYNRTYRVSYILSDDEIGSVPSVQTIEVDPQKYITEIDEYGIKIHPEIWNNESSYIQLDGTGMELFNSSGVSIAQYGNVARVGINNSSRFLINTDSLQAYNSNNQKYFEVNENGLSWGNNTAATISQVDMAAQTATNFISYDSTNGLQLASSLPLTATRKLQILNDAIKVQNDNSNYLNINSDGMQIWANSKKIADFGSDVILGDSNEAHSIFKSSALEFYTNTTNKIVSINNDGTFKVYDNDFPVMTVGSFNGFQGILLDCINLNKTGGHLFGIGSSKSSDTENFASHVTLSSYAEPSSTDTGYSDAYLQLEAMSNKGLNYHYISISAVKDGWSGIESSVAITVNSDERLKENCIPVNNISNLLFEIKPIVYSWKDKRTEQRYFGFKAQEVKAALERVVENVEEYAIVGKNRDGYYNLSYMELIPLIVDIIQKMNERIIELENKMEE